MTLEHLRIGNISQFVEAQTRYATRLVQDGVVFTSPIPEALRSLIRPMGTWSGNEDLLFPFVGPDNRGRAIGPGEKAPLGSFDTYGIMAKPPIEVAGYSYRISQEEDFSNGPMSLMVAQEKLTRPTREWNHAIAKELLNVFTAGAYEAGSAARTAGYTFRMTKFNGTSIVMPKATESAEIGSATIANANHQVRFPDKQGGQLAAGHDHLPADVGGPWTEALGRTARDHLLEHPGVNAVDAYIGANVVQDVWDVIKSDAAATLLAVKLGEEGTATEQEFGVPSIVGVHEGVRYWRFDALPDDLAVYYARGSRPIGLTVGVQRANGTRMPFSWNDAKNMDPELQAVHYGYRGPAGAQVVEPTKLFIHNYT